MLRLGRRWCSRWAVQGRCRGRLWEGGSLGTWVPDAICGAAVPTCLTCGCSFYDNGGSPGGFKPSSWGDTYLAPMPSPLARLPWPAALALGITASSSPSSRSPNHRTWDWSAIAALGDWEVWAWLAILLHGKDS